MKENICDVIRNPNITKVKLLSFQDFSFVVQGHEDNWHVYIPNKKQLFSIHILSAPSSRAFILYFYVKNDYINSSDSNVFVYFIDIESFQSSQSRWKQRLSKNPQVVKCLHSLCFRFVDVFYSLAIIWG